MDSKLYAAVISGDPQSPDENLINGEVTSGHWNSILHIAVKYRNLQVAEKIIAQCQSLLYQTNLEGDSPLHIAARLGHLEMARCLINNSKPLDIEAEKQLVRMQNQEKDTALHAAVRNGHMEIVKLLIDEDPELARVVNDAGESSLFIAVDRQLYEIACYIHEHAPTCSYGGRNGMNVLHVAIIRTHKYYSWTWTAWKLYSRWFIDQLFALFIPAFPTRQLAANNFRFIGSDFISEVLKRCPAAISEADNCGWLPLHHAAYLGNVQVVDILLKFDTSRAYIKDEEGMAAIHIAAMAGQDNVVVLLTAKYPDMLELVDDRGRTALHVAAENGNGSVVNIFLAIPVFMDIINNRDKDGNTAFHSAALKGQYGVLLLLANDSRVDEMAINKAGLTPLGIVTSSAQLEKPQKVQILWKRKKYRMTKNPMSLEEYLELIKKGKDKVIAVEEQSPQEMGRDRKVAAESEEEAEPARVKNKRYQGDKEMGDVTMVVSTLIATVTFAAGFTVPGGYISSGQDKQGTAVLQKEAMFKCFVIWNSLAFGSSIASTFLNFMASGLRGTNAYIASFFYRYSFLLNYFSIIAMIYAFLSGIYVVLGGTLAAGAVYAAFVFYCLGALIFIFLVYWSSRLYFYFN